MFLGGENMKTREEIIKWIKKSATCCWCVKNISFMRAPCIDCQIPKDHSSYKNIRG